jgi:hypothetical protein
MNRYGRGPQSIQRAWTVVYWVLMAAFLLTAALNMLQVRAGFLTNYLADLTVPALLFVVSRGVAPGQRTLRYGVMRWIGRTPLGAAGILFLGSVATEVSQIFWPRGIFAGRFDPWDIVAYGVGLLMCYAFDRMCGVRTPVAAAAPAQVEARHAAGAASRRTSAGQAPRTSVTGERNRISRGR